MVDRRNPETTGIRLSALPLRALPAGHAVYLEEDAPERSIASLYLSTKPEVWKL
jgi:hypothetical protein